jgi:hypothetical protein
MWILADYEAVTLFSLRLSSATASGGKTLLTPTPYAFKMALLDVACRTLGLAEAERVWPQLRDLSVAFRPAPQAVVTNLFQKVLRPRRNPAPLYEPDAGPFQRTIGYREYVQLVGPLGVALGEIEATQQKWLVDLLLNVSYLGKRGSFMQLQRPPLTMDTLPNHYVHLSNTPKTFALGGVLQMLDDCAPSLTFSRANIYSGERVTVGKERIIRHVVLPYRLTRSSKSFSLYERLD